MDNKSRKTFVPKDISSTPCKTHGFFVPLLLISNPARAHPHHLATEKMGKGRTISEGNCSFLSRVALEMPKQRNGKWRWSIQLRAAPSNWNWSEHERCWFCSRMACCTTSNSHGLLHFPHLSSSSLRDPHLLFIFLFEVQSSQSRNGARVEEIQISRDSLVRGIPEFIGRHPNKQDFRTEWLTCLDMELANIPQGHVLFPEKIGRDDFLGSFFVAGGSWKVVISRGIRSCLSLMDQILEVTIPETNITPEDRPLEKEIPSWKPPFSGLC